MALTRISGVTTTIIIVISAIMVTMNAKNASEGLWWRQAGRQEGVIVIAGGG